MSVALNLDHAAALRPTVSPVKPSLLGLSRPELATALIGHGMAEREARMRANQLWNWLYQRGTTDFAEMANIGKPLREVPLPRETVLTAILRGERVITPTPDEPLEAGDELLFVAHAEVEDQLKTVLAPS